MAELKYTYNEVINKYGEEVGLAYEKYVIDLIESGTTGTDPYLIADIVYLVLRTKHTLHDAKALLAAAVVHARQEMIDAHKAEIDALFDTK